MLQDLKQYDLVRLQNGDFWIHDNTLTIRDSELMICEGWSCKHNENCWDYKYVHGNTNVSFISILVLQLPLLTQLPRNIKTALFSKKKQEELEEQKEEPIEEEPEPAEVFLSDLEPGEKFTGKTGWAGIIIGLSKDGYCIKYHYCYSSDTQWLTMVGSKIYNIKKRGWPDDFVDPEPVPVPNERHELMTQFDNKEKK